MNKGIYYKSEEMKEDIQQTVLTETGIKANDSPLAKKQIDLTNRKVFCPFCLKEDWLNSFLLKSKGGINRRFCKCPECNTLMLLESVLNMIKFNARQYAKWIYEYPFAEYWKKCFFNIWKLRLKELGMSFDFWEEYKKLKEVYSYSENQSREDD